MDKTVSTEVALNLCLATPLFAPFYSGSAERFRRYLPGLLARNINPFIFTATPPTNKIDVAMAELSWQTQPVGKTYSNYTSDNIPVTRLRLPDNHGRQSDFLFGKKLAYYCQQAPQKFDVIQLVSLSLWSSPWLLQLRQQNIPTVLAYTLLDQFAQNKLKRRLQSYYWQLPFRLTNCVVVNSQTMKQNLDQLNVKTNVQVIPNGVDLKRFRPALNRAEKEILRQKLNIKSDETLLVTIGAIQPRKRTNLIVKAWHHLVAKEKLPVHLLVIGPRTDKKTPEFASIENEIENLIEASGAKTQIHFIEYTEQVEKYLQASDIFVFASIREGLPNAILEAMASGLPVITTSFIGITKEIGNANEHYLLVEAEAEAMSRTIQAAIQNNHLQKQLGQAGRNWIETTMNLEDSLDKYADLYFEVAGPGLGKR